MTALDDALEAHLDATHEARVASYKDFLRIPSISGIPAHADDCRRAATWLADALRTAGIEHVEVAETGGHPVVYGDWLHAEGAPTVLVYGHYDVQPVDPLDLWTSPPFEPVVVDGRMLARGAADDKGQIHLHVMAAAAILATRGALPGQRQLSLRGRGGVVVGPPRRLAGGEPGAAGGRRRDHQRQRASSRATCRRSRSACAGSCTPRSTSSGPGRRPPLGGLRRRGREPGQRAGHDHRRAQGPGRPDPVPGFYDDVVALTDDDRAALAALPFDEAAYQADHRRAGARRRGRVHRPGAQGRRGPTLDVNGIWGGFKGEGAKTIIPAHAHAKISCRLVADQDPERDLRALPRLRRGDRAARRHDDGHLPRRRPAEPHPDRPSGDAGRRAGARGDLRPRAGLHPRGRQRSRSSASFETILGLPVVLLGFTAARRPRPCPQRVDGPRQLRDGASGRSSAPSTSWPRPRSDGVGSPPAVRTWRVRVGDSGVPSATLCATAPSRRYAPREHRSRADPKLAATAGARLASSRPTTAAWRPARRSMSWSTSTTR